MPKKKTQPTDPAAPIAGGALNLDAGPRADESAPPQGEVAQGGPAEPAGLAVKPAEPTSYLVTKPGLVMLRQYNGTLQPGKVVHLKDYDPRDFQVVLAQRDALGLIPVEG